MDETIYRGSLVTTRIPKHLIRLHDNCAADIYEVYNHNITFEVLLEIGKSITDTVSAF